MKLWFKKNNKTTEQHYRLSGWLAAMLAAMVLVVAGSIATFISYTRYTASMAIHNTSLFYLEELSSNVSQVFKTHFDGYLKELRLALLATKEAEHGHETRDELEEHLGSMAERGDFLYYALLDEDGEVYISSPDYLSDFLVRFLRNCDFNGDEITLEIRSENAADDIFIIAQKAQEGTYVNGKRIIAGAKGIAKSKVRHEILLRGEDNSAFVHMIMSDGTYIISGDNKKLVQSENYFTDLRNVATFSDRYSLEKMIADIQSEKDGSTAYYVGGMLYYCYYSFLPRSGWSIAVTVPFDTVSTTLQKATDMTTTGGIILILLMVALVSTLFAVYMRQKKTSLLLDLQRLDAEERSSAKSSFLSNMSHDIRTPMNAIIGFTELALQQDSSPKVRDYLIKISVSSSHLLSLINDVLDMSRIESGKMQITEVKCTMSEIIHGIRTIIQGQVYEKQQFLYMDAIDVVDENIWCDKIRMNQMLLNFLSNAVKFTPTGGTIALIIRQLPGKRDGYGEYEFHIRDTGIGMTKEFCERVFEPFEREQSATVNAIQGTGLGMAIAKSIAQMMHGDVRVESELGKGTEFIVNVELRLQEADEHTTSPICETISGTRVLVAGDDAVSGTNIVATLHELGADVKWAVMGHETLLRLDQKISEGDVCRMLIIDWHLPNLSGLESLRILKERNIAILLASSYSWNELESEAREAGITLLTTKPLFRSDLQHLLLEALGEDDTSADAEGTSLAAHFAGKRVLLVDDNELNREIASAILEEYNFLVETAENGKIALEMVADSEAEYYQVVLMDVQMPVMNGYDATQAIRALPDEKIANVPILAMTANAFAEDRKKALESGMNGHLAKPIEVSRLLEVLADLL